MRYVVPFVLLSATSVVASTPAPEGQGGEYVAVIWGGGKDAEAAKASVAKWESERELVAKALVLAEGFPKTVSSGSVPGLNPGFEVVLLGFCRSDESAVQRRLLKAYHPFIYERPVTQAVSACPKWKEAGGERVVQEPAMLKVGLSGVTLTRVVSRLKPPVSLGDGRVVLWLDVVARDAAGKYLGKVSMEDEHSPTGMGMEGCDTTLEPSRKTAFVVTRRCTYAAGAACNFLPSDTTRTVVKWDGQKLVEEDKVIEKRELNYDRDCAE
ncbi:hypothetical protein K8640_14935 [Myxococcus sp. XM-1-1-1]|uniref:hypothetical protein n=1 Tax=Myxococcus sp. XM-1-1-1 TaxID=2874602 RepID=UPI001CBF0342|nr:hypothetical protein [Myxococcus sp. XM-1-1-1]MBZ4409517.1 hypothetical protein [Myxococcus sp. XM-1-1-1]